MKITILTRVVQGILPRAIIKPNLSIPAILQRQAGMLVRGVGVLHIE